MLFEQNINIYQFFLSKRILSKVSQVIMIFDNIFFIFFALVNKTKCDWSISTQDAVSYWTHLVIDGPSSPFIISS